MLQRTVSSLVALIVLLSFLLLNLDGLAPHLVRIPFTLAIHTGLLIMFTHCCPKLGSTTISLQDGCMDGL